VSVVKKDAAADKGVLFITQGSKLVVNGTGRSTVVLLLHLSNKAPGDWGGLIIAGKAPTNVVSGNVDGLDCFKRYKIRRHCFR
jgi:hypothetical protein